MAEKGAYLVANLVAYVAMKERARDFGMPEEMLEKNEMVLEGGYKSARILPRGRGQGGLRLGSSGRSSRRPEP
ncbi:MAG: hypothetical protein R3C97_03830 [Geminicoccaceae bacterium]